MANTPFMPPMSPYVLPQEPFNVLLANYGIQLQWMKGHECPCVMGNFSIPGSPDPECTSCGGRGVYWDLPSEPFYGLLTHIGRTNYGAEPGSQMDPEIGGVWSGNPTITLPPSQGEPWAEASVFDAFIEPQAQQLFNTTLTVGYNTALPYRQNLSVSASGAVRVYDPQAKSVVLGVPYAVASGVVSLGSGYPHGTAFTVEYYASPVYIVFRTAGGQPHFRPFGAQGKSLPVRLHCQLLDVWTRARQGANSTSPMAFGGG